MARLVVVVEAGEQVSQVAAEAAAFFAE